MGVFAHFPTIHRTYPLAFCSAVCQYIDMKCINCFHVKTHVTNSRPHSKPSVWRRRTCPKCQTTFTTYERPSLDEQPILAHDGQTMPFNIGRLTISIARSFQHNLHAARYDSLRLAETVEAKLLTSGTSLSADDIAAVAHATLKHYDPVAAVQYAAQHDLVTTTRRPGRPSVTYGT